MANFCPSCGYNIEADRPVVIGDWEVSPFGAKYRNQHVHLTRGEAIIVHTIASANGDVVRREALRDRVTEAEGNVVEVLLCRIRKKFGDICPIETVWGFGYRWKEG